MRTDDIVSPTAVPIDDSILALINEVTSKFDPDQPRDEDGRWSGDGADTKKFSSKESADAWGRGTQGWASAMTDAQDRSIGHYTTYVGINDALRGNRKYETSFTGVEGIDPIAEIDGLFAHPDAVLKEPVTVYRAWRGTGPSKKEVGSTFRDKGFTSTALHRGEIYDFFGEGRSRGTEVEIRVPAGTRALYLGTKPDGKSWFANSSELLINRGTRYRVLETDKNVNAGRARRVVLEVVP